MSEQTERIQTFESPALIVTFAHDGTIHLGRDDAQISCWRAAWCLVMVAKRVVLNHG